MYSLEPTYITQIQKPHFCAIACLNMILYRQLGIIYEQEQLGLYFDISIQPSTVQSFTHTFRTTTAINEDEGFVTIEEQERVNTFFQERELPLQAESFKLSKILSDFKTLKNFITTQLKLNNDMWVEYKVGAVWQGYTGMHDGLIESIEGDSVILINPDKDDKNRESVALILLEDALSDRIARETGIVIIKKI